MISAAVKTRQPRQGKHQFVQVEPDGSDAWRLDPIIKSIRDGGVGIIPTDTSPSFVCDLENKGAVQKLYELKQMSPSKKLSILCRNFQDIAKYTMGFPMSSSPGQPDMFKVARKILPGPYTLILHASKCLPKQVTNYDSGKSKHRTTVGVRMPDDVICQAILSQLDRPLLCSTAKLDGADADAGVPDAATFLDAFGPRGLDFVVDVGPRPAELSTVVDLSEGEPEVLRQGRGEVVW